MRSIKSIMQSILLSLFPLIAFIFTGYILKNRQFFSDGFWVGVEKLNYYFLFPAMLFGNLASARIDFNMVNTIVMVLVAMLGIACSALYLIGKIYKTPAARFGVYTQSNVRFNTYIGLAIVASLFQHQGMTLFAIILAISIPVVNILSILALTEKEGMDFRSVSLSLLKNPLIMGCVIGVLFNFSGLELWGGISAFIQQLANCSLPLGLMCVGAALQFMALKNDLWPLLINTFSRLLIMPALAYVVCQLFEFSTLETQIFVLYFALPTASASYILTKVLKGDSQLMAGVISLQTICSAITLPIVLTLIM